MGWIEPVTLTGAHVVLEPVAERHHADLLAAGQDDRRLGLAAVAAPATEADVAAMLAGERAVALPVRAGRRRERPRGRRHDLPRRRRAPPHARGRRHVDRAAVVAHRDQHRGQAAVPRPRVRDARREPRRDQDRHPQRALAGGDRAARRRARGRAAPPVRPPRRQPARHGDVLDRPGRVAGREGAAARAARGARVNVARLAIAPVKGMRLVDADELEIDANGARGDRAFCVVDAETRLQLTTRTPRLLQVVPRWDGDDADAALPRRQRGGGGAGARRARDDRATTRAAPIHGRLVDGALSDAVAEHLGRDVRLFARDDGERLADDAPVSLMSGASLAALAPALDGAVPDPRRFRMTIAIDGAAAWEEHGWGGREIAGGRRAAARDRARAALRRDDARPRRRPHRPAGARRARAAARQARRHVRDLVRSARSGARPRRRSGARRLSGHACDRAVVSLAPRGVGRRDSSPDVR